MQLKIIITECACLQREMFRTKIVNRVQYKEISELQIVEKATGNHSTILSDNKKK